MKLKRFSLVLLGMCAAAFSVSARAIVTYKGADCESIGKLVNLAQNVDTDSGTWVVARYLENVAFAPAQLGGLGTYLPTPQLAAIRTEAIAPWSSTGKSDPNDTSAIQVKCVGETKVDFLLNSWATLEGPSASLKGGPQISYRHSFWMNGPYLADATSGGGSLVLSGTAKLLSGNFSGGGKCELNLAMELKKWKGGEYLAIQFNLATVGNHPLAYAIVGNDGQNAYFSAPARRFHPLADNWYTVLSGNQYFGAMPEVEFSIGLSAQQLGNILSSAGFAPSLSVWQVLSASMYIEAVGPESGTVQGVDESSCAGSFRRLRLESRP